MKILVVSQTYSPKVGGLETIMTGLATGFAENGHQVKVLTEIGAKPDVGLEGGVEVHRKVSFREKFKLYKEADRVLEANIGLKTAFLGLRFRKKWWVVHHIQYQHGKRVLPYFKNFLTYFSNNIAVSQFIKGTLWGSSEVIHNFYDPQFRILPGVARDKSLIFVGRLVSDKGADLLIEALHKLTRQGAFIDCTIAGDGPEKDSLQKLVLKYGLENIVQFTGNIVGEDLVKLMNRHKIMVVPSRWEEPFGLVVLEGLACGCSIVFSNAGGLPEAAGKIGHSFERGNVDSLVTAVKEQATNPTVLPEPMIAAHLSAHSKKDIVKRYLHLLQNGRR